MAAVGIPNFMMLTEP